jgi:hypothetical protein
MREQQRAPFSIEYDGGSEWREGKTKGRKDKNL